ncbi:MAG: hypothetical protein IPJ77_10625 [Planctomycetes bacterium]|nr:hypothetical protein [Planctomycetota bacterium]
MVLRSCSLVAFLCTPALAQNVLVVANTGPGAVQTAVDAAVEGDTLLIQPGSYAACVVANKGLVLQADPAGSVVLDKLQITGLALGKRVFVKGVALTHVGMVSDLTNAPYLVQGCAGSVRFQDVTVSMPAPNFQAGLVLSGSTDVALSRCVLTGPSSIQTWGGTFATGIPQPGLVLNTSRVALDHVAITGGDGHLAFYVPNWPTPLFDGAEAGADACRLDAASVLFAHGCTFQGGDGGNGTNASCDTAGTILIPVNGTPGANAGNGLSVAAGGSATELACTFTPGNAGTGGAASSCGGLPSAAGLPGLPIAGASASIVDAPLALDTPTHVRAGQPIQLTVHGTPGDLVLLANSAQTRWVFDPLYEGVFLFGASARRTVLGTIPASGTLTYVLSTTLLPPGVLATHRVLQLVARHPSGQLELGGAAYVTILDPSF